MFKIESYKTGIALSGIFNFFAKIISFANSIIVAYYFGSQSKMDIYFYVLAAINMIIGFINSLDHAVFIPESMRIREQENNDRAMEFLNFFLYAYFFIGILLTSIIYISPVSIFTFISKFEKDALYSNINLLYLMSPLCLLILLSNYLVNIMASYKFFTMPMIAGVINSLFSIVFIIVFHAKLDIRSISTALLFGYGVNIIILLFLMKFSLNWNFKFRKISLSAKTVKNIFFNQAGIFTSTMAAYIPLYLLSGLSAGIITALNYAKKITEIPNDLITTHFCNVSIIKFNELYARNNMEEFNNIFVSVVNFLVFILMPISGMFFLYSEEIIAILYRRGAFDAESVALSASFARFLGLILPCYAINSMVGRLFVSSQKLSKSFLYQISFNFFLCVLYIFLIPYYGIYGYIVTLLFGFFLNVFTSYFLCRLFLSSIKYSKILGNFVILLTLNTLITIIIYNLNRYLTLNFFIRLIIGGCIYTGILSALNHFFRLNKDISIYLSVLKKRLFSFACS